MNTRTRNLILNGLAIAGAAYFIHWAQGNLDGYKIQVLNLIAVNAILALSLNLIYGFTGMFSLGHAGFMAIGAYVCALLILTPAQKTTMWILQPLVWPLSVIQTPFFVAVLMAGLVAAVCGLLIALPVLRLGGDYLGIATLGFAEIIRVVLTNLSSITNGALGIKGIPAHANLWWNYGWLLLTLFFIIRLVNSNFGNVLKAIRDDEIAAKNMGINTFFYRVVCALMGSLITTIDPKMFVFTLTFNVLMITVAGGLGSITGSLIGSVVITVLLEWLRIVENPLIIGSFEIPGIPGMRMVIFSLALILIILFRSEGIMGMKEFSWNSLFGSSARGGKTE